MNIFERLWFKAKTGANVVDYTDVETTEYVVRFKDIYIVVDEMSDGNYSVGWTKSPTMSHVPIRDFWVAKPPKKS